MRCTPTRPAVGTRQALLVGVLVMLAPIVLLHGQDAAPSVTPPYASTRPTIDGRLEDAAWREAAALRDFWLPEPQRKARTPTEVRVLRDDTTLYVAFVCIGDPAPDAPQMGGLKDHVTVEVDPGGSQAYRTFTVNRDGRQFENGVEQRLEPAVWRGAAAQNDGGWTAELAIPLGLLGQVVLQAESRVDFIRYRAQTREWSRWADRSARGEPADVGRLRLSSPPARQAAAVAPVQTALPPPAAVDSRPLDPETDHWSMPPMPPPDRSRPPGFDPVPPPVAGPPATAAPAPPQPQDTGAYVLQLGDMIEVKHFDNPELNELLPIRPDGRISLELVGEVQAAGLPVSDLQAILLQRYAEFVRQPEVAIIVKEFGGNRVYIGGEVPQPGVLQTNGRLTVLQAIFQAGGFLRSAELRSVVVLRNQGTATPAFLTFDLEDSLTTPGEHMNDALLRPYDIVYVPKSRVARMGDFVDQYIDELIPLPVTLGISYLFR